MCIHIWFKKTKTKKPCLLSASSSLLPYWGSVVLEQLPLVSHDTMWFHTSGKSLFGNKSCTDIWNKAATPWRSLHHEVITLYLRCSRFPQLPFVYVCWQGLAQLICLVWTQYFAVMFVCLYRVTIFVFFITNRNKNLEELPSQIFATTPTATKMDITKDSGRTSV